VPANSKRPSTTADSIRQTHVISIAPPVIGGIAGYHPAAAHRAFQNTLQDRPLPISFQGVRSPAATPHQIIHFGPGLADYDRWLFPGIDLTLVLHLPNVEDVGQQPHQCRTVKLLSDMKDNRRSPSISGLPGGGRQPGVSNLGRQRQLIPVRCLAERTAQASDSGTEGCGGLEDEVLRRRGTREGQSG